MKGCGNVIIDNAGTMIGHICHIEAAKPDGARFNASMTNEQRRAQDNLMLLCASHHAAVDGNPSTYTITKLKKIKAEHEGRFSEIEGTLKRWFESEYVDNTTLIQATKPKSLRRLKAYFDEEKVEFTDKHATKALVEIGKYLRLASVVPQRERELIKLIFQRAKRLKFSEHGQVIVDADDFISAFGYSLTRLKRQAKMLEDYGVGSLQPEDDGRASLRLSDPSNYVRWTDLDGFCEKEGLSIDAFLLRLDFAQLD
ncbi:hypothetical protein MJC1_04108 [Methylocystis sp. MJC1]|uniref:hypothetical protein n=2 Tax=Methylocystis sp. MJC1 TaxID=2654282 RepID=UPI0013EB2959|nr:hypothetical protein [Methylocystis sp. MJC1]KAF2988817.1 hypothetical protein MJC1_04108 [Methylocystis sp. MJC1]